MGYLSKQGNIIKEKQSFYNGVYSILEDKDGNIWLGTKEIGLFQLKKTGANHYSIHHFEHQTNDPYSLSSKVLEVVEQYKQRLLEDWRKVSKKPIDLNFRIHTPCFRLWLEQGNFTCFFRRFYRGRESRLSVRGMWIFLT